MKLVKIDLPESIDRPQMDIGQGVQGSKVPIGGWVTPATRPLGHWLTRITTGSLPHQTRPPSPIGRLVKEYQTLEKLYTRYREPFAQHDKTLEGT